MTAPQNSIPDEPKQTVRQAAKSLGVCYQSALSLINTGQLRAVKIGSRWATYQSWINDYLLSRQNQDQPASPSAEPQPLLSPETEAQLGQHGVQFAN